MFQRVEYQKLTKGRLKVYLLAASNAKSPNSTSHWPIPANERHTELSCGKQCNPHLKNSTIKNHETKHFDKASPYFSTVDFSRPRTREDNTSKLESKDRNVDIVLTKVLLTDCQQSFFASPGVFQVSWRSFWQYKVL